MRHCVFRIIFFVVLVFIITPAFTIFAKSGSFSLEKSKLIIRQIRDRQQNISQKYAGYSLIGDTTTRTYSSKSGELEETSRVVFSKKTLGGYTEEQEVLKYYKNGDELPPAEFKERGDNNQRYAVFGADREKHYEPQVIGMKPVNGINCYQVQTNPKDATKSHLKGYLFFDADSLELVRFEGSTAELPRGVKKMAIEIDYKSVDGYAVPANSDIEVHIHIPFIFPNKKLIIKSVFNEQKLIAGALNR